MEKYTFKKLIRKLDEILKPSKEEIEEYGSTSIYKLDELIYASEDRDSVIKILGNFQIVEDHGGEGEGESYWKVFHFIDHNIYFKIEGYYTSYEGIEWPGDTILECAKEVFPVQKTITVYETKKKSKKKPV